MYEQEVLEKLDDINQNVLDLGNYLNTMDLHIANSEVKLQEIVSGDSLTRKYIIDSNYRSSVYLGCINLILMVSLILSLLPARKGVLKKQ